MRKSAAPSFRKTDIPSNVSVPCRVVQTTLKTCNENIEITDPKQPTNSTIPTSDSKLMYNVEWGNRSTKKHKTFENDGILTISNKTATLRNSDGSYLGSSTIKPEDIEIGLQLSIGSNEIEIIDQALGVQLPLKRKSDDAGDDKAVNKKKPKSNPSCFQPYLNVANSVRKNSSAKMNYNLTTRNDFVPLIMPEPTPDHQLKFNASNRSVKPVSIISCCAKELRPHQLEGVRFLYECLMGFRNIEYFGCILADEMGLGKTLQCISVCYTLLKQGCYGLMDFISDSCAQFFGRELEQRNHEMVRSTASIYLPNRFLISYEMFAKHFDELKNVHFDIMICDQGHRLKNQSIKVATLLNQIDCPRRVILTGTPIQNDLQEFYALIDFVNPNILGTSSFFLRRTHNVINKYLPKKQEFVVFCKQTDLQRRILEQPIELYENNDDAAADLQSSRISRRMKT